MGITPRNNIARRLHVKNVAISIKLLQNYTFEIFETLHCPKQCDTKIGVTP